MTRFKFVLSVAIVSLLLSGTMAIGSAYIGSGDIIDGGVHENDIGKMAVTKTKIKTGAVNKYKLATGAVNTYKILDGTIQGRDISNGAVTAAKINRSGLNADMVDGKNASSFAASGHDHDISIPDHSHEGGGGVAPPRTEFLSIPTTEFAHSNMWAGLDGTFWYSARTTEYHPPVTTVEVPIYLPHGVQVTDLHWKVEDNSSLDATMTLYVNNDPNTQHQTKMGQVLTSGQAPGWQTLTDSTISAGVVDNQYNQYCLVIDVPSDVAGTPHGTDLKYAQVVIEYEVSE